MNTLKKVVWLGDSLKKLQQFPEEIKDSVGYALYKAQEGLVPKNAKPLKGIKPATLEILSTNDTGTYRAVYTVKVSDVIYVLHCFQKKSKQGIKTPKKEIDLIKRRLQEAILVETLKGQHHEI